MVPETFRLLTDGDLASIFFFVSAVLFNVKRHIISPRLMFANMWAMRVCYASFFSFLVNAFAETKRPFSMLMVTILLAVFLFESVRLWALTSVFTRIDIPIFPRFKPCVENFIWPMGKYFDGTRELLIKHGFSEKAFLKIGGESLLTVYSPVFYDHKQHSRLQIIFDSFHIGRFSLNCILTSFMKNEKAIVTNNLQTVFASFYPKSWDVKRYPMASLEELLKIHAARIRGRKTIKINTTNTWEMINSENHRIELENCEAGFCEKLNDRSYVTLTFFGRYQLWKDMLLYAYLGRSI